MNKILHKFGIHESAFLGKGGEGDVFALDPKRIIKIFKTNDIQYLKDQQTLRDKILEQGFPLHISPILEIGNVDATIYTIEERVPGEVMSKVFKQSSRQEQKTLLDNYMKCIQIIGKIAFEDLPYGKMINHLDYAVGDTWQSFLIKIVQQKVEKIGTDLRHEVSNLDEKVERFIAAVDSLGTPHKSLVHGDYFMDNLMVTSDLNISGVLDFSAHTTIGDTRMDITAGLIFSHFDNENTQYLHSIIQERHGNEIFDAIKLYTVYYSFYYSHVNDDDEFHAWCVNNLNSF